MQARARESDTVARLGGDEFALLMDGVREREDPEALALRLVESMREPVLILGREVGDPQTSLLRRAFPAQKRFLQAELDRIVAQPDFQEGAVEALARDDTQVMAGDVYMGALAGQVIEQEHAAGRYLVRLLDQGQEAADVALDRVQFLGSVVIVQAIP
jgi:GGDEF domain-containing protein